MTARRGALALAVAVLAVLPARADAAWLAGWPDQPWTYDGVSASGGDALLVMRVRDGETENVPGARWDTVIRRPRLGRAVCIRYEVLWNEVPGAVRTLFLRPDVWPAAPLDPPMPEADLMETLTTGQTQAFTHPPREVELREHLLATWPAAPGVWHPFEFKLTRDWVQGSLGSPGGGTFSGPLWWPAGGYALVAGQWLLRSDLHPDWPDEYKARPGDDADAVQSIRDLRVQRCAADPVVPIPSDVMGQTADA